MVDGRGRGMAPDATRLWATSEITVDGRNQNVVLTLQPGMSVSGRVMFEGTTVPPPSDLTRVRVTLSPVVTPGTPNELSIPSPAASTLMAASRSRASFRAATD